MVWRGAISEAAGANALTSLLAAPMERSWPEGLHATASDIATELGWAKTYDAEYLALASLLSLPLLTLDARLQRGGGAVVEILGPGDL